jgi:peroxiredoxin
VIRWCGSPRVVGVIAAVSLPFAAYQAIQTRSSSRLVAELQGTVDAYSIVKVGTPVPALVGYDIHGERLSLSVSDGKSETLIFGVSGNCIYCLEMLDAHRRLAEAAASSGRKVYWVSRDRLEVATASVYSEMTDTSHLLVEPTHATYRALGLGATPQTVLVSPDGIVKAVWKGVASGNADAVEKEIRLAIGIT